MLKDAGNVIADQLGAVRTPEVFVLDADRVVRYWGRIDDQYGFFEKGVALSAGSSRTRRDLAVALDEVLAGKTVSVPAIAKAKVATSAASSTPDANSEVTYTKHIAPIFNQNCVYCHRDGQIAPFPLTSTKTRPAGPR